jgi:5-methylcytosine-specific restriction enzyme A
MPKKKLTDPQAVYRAIADYDELGEEAFFDRYSFKKARYLRLVVNGRKYASKAIYGAALYHQYGEHFTSEDFSGGMKQVVEPLQRLGFEIIIEGKNPPWSRDELILALNLYVRSAGRSLSKDSPEVVALSDSLNALHKAIGTRGSQSLRNPVGVAMELAHFHQFDPVRKGKGQTGLKRGNRLAKEVWDEFHTDFERLQTIATAILASIRQASSSDFGEAAEALLSESEEAPEGRILTVTHLKRERCRKLVRLKKEQVKKATGRLACEACGFEYLSRYGEHGRDFIECHHTKPVEALAEGEKTHLRDLALLCANCHRMVHARRPWLSIADLRELLVPVKS